MKLSDKQALMLFEIAKNSLRIKDDSGMAFSFDDKTRLDLINAIFTQQNENIVELDKEVL
jgi:hypothetical protein